MFVGGIHAFPVFPLLGSVCLQAQVWDLSQTILRNTTKRKGSVTQD